MFVKRSLESRRSFLRYLWIFFGVSLDFCKSPIQLPWAFVRDFHEIALNLRLHLIFAWSLLDVHSAFCMSNVFCLLLASLDFRWMFDGCSLDAHCIFVGCSSDSRSMWIPLQRNWGTDELRKWGGGFRRFHSQSLSSSVPQFLSQSLSPSIPQFLSSVPQFLSSSVPQFLSSSVPSDDR